MQRFKDGMEQRLNGNLLQLPCRERRKCFYFTYLHTSLLLSFSSACFPVAWCVSVMKSILFVYDTMNLSSISESLCLDFDGLWGHLLCWLCLRTDYTVSRTRRTIGMVGNTEVGTKPCLIKLQTTIRTCQKQLLQSCSPGNSFLMQNTQ